MRLSWLVRRDGIALNASYYLQILLKNIEPESIQNIQFNRNKHFKRKTLLWTHLYHKQINARQTNNTKGFFYRKHRKFLRKFILKTFLCTTIEHLSLENCPDNDTSIDFWDFLWKSKWILLQFEVVRVTLWFVWSELW